MSKNNGSKLNTLFMLIGDEITGFYRSKVMIFLIFGLPILSVLMLLLNPDTEGIPILYFVSLIVSSLGGTLGSVMLATSIVNEKNHHVYDLFVIRKENIRTSLILAKFISVYLCLIVTVFISLLAGVIIDNARGVSAGEVMIEDLFDSLWISMSAMAIACSLGILIGLVMKSVPVAAILSIYIGNQVSMISVIPGILIEEIDAVSFAITVGIIVTIVAMIINLMIIKKKQL